MDAQAGESEMHDYNEGLLVLDGQMRLSVEGKEIVRETEQMYMAMAGVTHAVLPGSHGTLVLVDL